MSTVNLKRLEFSPHENPLLEPQEIHLRRRYVQTGISRDLVDPSTGEVSAAAVVKTVEEKDDAEFVKVFAAGVSALYDLNKTSARVFQAILREYEKTPMSGGFADSVYLSWFDGGLSGQAVGMSEKTFQRGLKDLLEKGFLAPRSPNLFWVNPALFFKGDRVAFVREYRRKKPLGDAAERAELEAKGQQRLID